MPAADNNNWFTAAAQFLLSGYDVQQATSWRGHARQWRQEDVRWTVDEQLHVAGLEHLNSLHQRTWRKEAREQVHVNNATYRWQSYVSTTKSEIQLKLEQLKGVAFTSAILAGFATTSFLQFGYDTTSVSSVVNWMYALSTAVSVGLSCNAMVLATVVQASIMKIYRKYVSSHAEAEYFAACVRFVHGYTYGSHPNQPNRNHARSFDTFWKHRCAPAFKSIYILFLAALLTFVLNVGVAVWIVFNPNTPPVSPTSDGGGGGGDGTANATSYTATTMGNYIIDNTTIYNTTIQNTTPSVNASSSSSSSSSSISSPLVLGDTNATNNTTTTLLNNITTGVLSTNVTTDALLGNITAGLLSANVTSTTSNSTTTSPDDTATTTAASGFPQGIPITLSIMLGLSVMVCLLIGQRFLLHVLGRGASVHTSRPTPTRGLPFDWDAVLVPVSRANSLAPSRPPSRVPSRPPSRPHSRAPSRTSFGGGSEQHDSQGGHEGNEASGWEGGEEAGKEGATWLRRRNTRGE